MSGTWPDVGEATNPAAFSRIETRILGHRCTYTGRVESWEGKGIFLFSARVVEKIGFGMVVIVKDTFDRLLQTVSYFRCLFFAQSSYACQIRYAFSGASIMTM